MTVKILSLESFVASQILGDGYISSTHVLAMRQSVQWYDYLYWKIQLALSLGLEVSEPKYEIKISNIQKQTVVTCYARVSNVGMVSKSPVELVKNLDPLGLLLWWLDDGCLSVHEKKNGYSVSRFGYLGTENFDEWTNVQIAQALFEKFNLDCRVHVDRGGIKDKNMTYYRLYLNATNMRVMIDIFRQYIPMVPPSMIYKLNMGYRPTRNSKSLEYAELYNFS